MRPLIRERWAPWLAVEKAWEHGRDDEADRLIDEGLRDRPDFPAVRLMAALREIRRGSGLADPQREEQLAEHLQKSIDNAGDELALMLLASAYTRAENGNWQQSFSLLQRFREVTVADPEQMTHLPTAAQHSYLVGLIALRKDRFDVAKSCFDGAKEGDPRRVEYWRALALIQEADNWSGTELCDALMGHLQPSDHPLCDLMASAPTGALIAGWNSRSGLYRTTLEARLRNPGVDHRGSGDSPHRSGGIK